MNSTSVIDTCPQRVRALVEDADAVDRISRMVSVSILATFLRDFPLTYLTAEERRVFIGFQSYVVRLEGRLFEEAGIGT